jgi:hypothetical protein
MSAPANAPSFQRSANAESVAAIDRYLAAKRAPRERGILFSASMVRAILAGRKTQTRRLYKPRYPEPYEVLEDGVPMQCDEAGDYHRRLEPFGVPGDRLWVRETWQYADWTEDGYPFIRYRADGTRRLCENHGSEWAERLSNTWSKLSEPENFKIDNRAADRKWRPSIFLPRWASRLTLEVTEVRVQRLQDISEEDARAEGVEPYVMQEGWSCMRKDGSSYSCFVEPDAENRKELVAVVHQPARELHSARESFANLWNQINFERAPWQSNPWVWCVSFKDVTP